MTTEPTIASDLPPRFYDLDEHDHPEGGSTMLGFWIYLMSDCLIFAILFACFAVLGGNFQRLLTATWGGVLWLLAAATQMFVAIAIPNFFPAGRAVAIFDLSLIVAYFVLTWQASREDGHRLLSSHLFRR